MWIRKAHVLKGNNKEGYQVISNAVADLKTMPNEVSTFTSLFGSVICKKVSMVVCKERGYTGLFKMHAQRLFTCHYPKVDELENKAHLMMQLCSMVSL